MLSIAGVCVAELEPNPNSPCVTVIIPVYNEAQTLRALIEKVLDVPVRKQVIAVDDGSSDDSAVILQEFANSGDIETWVHETNRGKGAAIRTGLRHARGSIILIQDADLEYDPGQYVDIIEPLTKQDGATVVYGSRFRGEAQRMSRWHWFGNHLVTAVFNLLYGTRLTDMETCYKAIRRDALDGITLESDRWGFDPEITAKLVRAGLVIVEVPVDYSGRDFSAGKKLRWKDGFSVLVAIVRYRFSG